MTYQWLAGERLRGRGAAAPGPAEAGFVMDANTGQLKAPPLPAVQTQVPPLKPALTQVREGLLRVSACACSDHRIAEQPARGQI